MKYYIYAHYRNDGSVFYIGKGHRKRAWSKTGRSIFWHRTVNKYGLSIKIWASDLDEITAFNLEKEWISVYGRKDIGNGNLVNLTDGGEGSSGTLVSEETRNLLNKNLKRRLAENPESFKAFFESAKGNKHNLGRKQSEATINKKREKTIGHIGPNRKFVKCIETEQVFRSVYNCSQNTGIDRAHISAVCNGKRKTAGGFTFIFINVNSLNRASEVLGG